MIANPAITFLLPVEVAALFKVSLRQVEKWIVDGDIQVHGKGDPRISEESVVKFAIRYRKDPRWPAEEKAAVEKEYERWYEELVQRVINAEAQRTQRIAEAA